MNIQDILIAEAKAELNQRIGKPVCLYLCYPNPPKVIGFVMTINEEKSSVILRSSDGEDKEFPPYSVSLGSIMAIRGLLV